VPLGLTLAAATVIAVVASMPVAAMLAVAAVSMAAMSVLLAAMAAMAMVAMFRMGSLFTVVSLTLRCMAMVVVVSITLGSMAMMVVSITLRAMAMVVGRVPIVLRFCSVMMAFVFGVASGVRVVASVVSSIFRSVPFILCVASGTVSISSSLAVVF